MGDSARFVNEDPNRGFVIRSRKFRMHQFKPVVDCGLLRDRLDSFKDRTCPHVTLRKAFPPKRKSGREPTGRDRRASSKPRIIRKRFFRSKQGFRTRMSFYADDCRGVPPWAPLRLSIALWQKYSIARRGSHGGAPPQCLRPFLKANICHEFSSLGKLFHPDLNL